MKLGLDRQEEAAPAASSPPGLRNWGLPALAAILGIGMLVEASGLQLFDRYTKLGPGFMVALVGAALLVLSVALAWQVRSGVSFDPEAAEGADADAPVSRTGLLLAASGVALPIVTIPWLGFPLGGALAYACITRAYGSKRTLVDALIGLALAGVTWFAFSKLGVQLGPFLPFGAGR